METYTRLRHFADSWALVVLVALFVLVILYAFRPGARRLQRDAAESIFRNERRPAPAPDSEVE